MVVFEKLRSFGEAHHFLGEAFLPIVAVSLTVLVTLHAAVYADNNKQWF